MQASYSKTMLRFDCDVSSIIVASFAVQFLTLMVFQLLNKQKYIIKTMLALNSVFISQKYNTKIN